MANTTNINLLHKPQRWIRGTGIFPSGPINNGPMDGRFLFYFYLFSCLFFLLHLALVTMITLPAWGERHASARPTVLSCRHSREVTIGPVACLSKEYLAQWPYERLQRPRSPTHTCSRPPHPITLIFFLPSWAPNSVLAPVQLHWLHHRYLHH